jgi:choline dehydrogenase-like flavoprotein
VHLPYVGAPTIRSEAELRRAMNDARPERYRFTLNSVHPQSSLAIGADAERGAVSPEGEVWGAPGVYVADASIFPTSIGVPPQVTIMALASAVADAVRA